MVLGVEGLKNGAAAGGEGGIEFIADPLCGRANDQRFGSPAGSSRSRSWITSGSLAEPSSSESYRSSARASVTAPSSKSFCPVASTDRSWRAHIRI
jgi:hypothetical protein